MKRFITSFYDNELIDEEKIIPSHAFEKEFEKQLMKILKPEIGNFINFKDIQYAFRSIPVEVQKNELFYLKVKLVVFGTSFYGELEYIYMKANGNPFYFEEIEKDSVYIVKFKLDIEMLKWHLKHESEKRNKIVIEDVKFKAVINDIRNTDIKYLIEFDEVLNPNSKNSFLLVFKGLIAEFNKNENDGLIHLLVDCKFSGNKKVQIIVDNGSAGIAGIEYLIKELNKTEFNIKEIEVKNL